MSKADKIMKELESLNSKDLQKVIDKIKDKYISKDAIVLNENYTWWNNEEDDIYNEK